eukprot:CCRYP_019616-RA/>CCRYP_019616-RA protein AED:0.25 eAED:0.28 QI:0/0/0.5/1/0/0/2/349/100
MVDFGDETHILQKRIILPIKPLPNHPPLHHPKPMRTRSPKPLQTIRRPAHAPSPTRLGKPPQHLLDIKRWFSWAIPSRVPYATARRDRGWHLVPPRPRDE